MINVEVQKFGLLTHPSYFLITVITVITSLLQVLSDSSSSVDITPTVSSGVDVVRDSGTEFPGNQSGSKQF